MNHLLSKWAVVFVMIVAQLLLQLNALMLLSFLFRANKDFYSVNPLGVMRSAPSSPSCNKWYRRLAVKEFTMDDELAPTNLTLRSIVVSDQLSLMDPFLSNAHSLQFLIAMEHCLTPPIMHYEFHLQAQNILRTLHNCHLFLKKVTFRLSSWFKF